MQKKLIILLTAILSSIIFISNSADASWWRRMSANGCGFQNTEGSLPSGDGPGTAGFTITANTSGRMWLYCPLEDASWSPDNTINSITIDLMNFSSSTLPQNVVYGEVCLLSGWSASCGGSTGSPIISANWGNGLGISDLSLVKNDTGNGYPTVVIFTNISSGYNITVVGVYSST